MTSVSAAQGFFKNDSINKFHAKKIQNIIW